MKLQRKSLQFLDFQQEYLEFLVQNPILSKKSIDWNEK